MDLVSLVSGRQRGVTTAVLVLLAIIVLFNSWSQYPATTSAGIRPKPVSTHEDPSSHEGLLHPVQHVSPFDDKKLAFMVETRVLPHLPAQFLHMAGIIPPEWKMKFMGTPNSTAFMRARPAIANLEATGRLRIELIPEQYSMVDRETISQMFTDPKLYKDILAPAEHLLVFQPDAIFCANSEQSLNDYLEWDWVGAPWSKTAQFGGNGGLSLRKVSRILDALEKKGPRRHGDGALEDLWLASRLHELDGWHMPNATISKHFSVESVWDDRPLGYHIGWLGVHHEQIWDEAWMLDHIFEYCPEVKLILNMGLVGDKPPGVP